MVDHLRSLAVFAKVVDCGSFRAAARGLALSPSVVSHHIGELERHLSLPLLYRSTRRLALTPDGQKLVTAAREMVEAAARGLDAVSGQSESPTGTLRVTAPAFLTETTFCRDLAAFSKLLPKVQLMMSFTELPRELLRDGFDLALRIGKLDDSTHKTRKLAEMRRLLVCTPGYRKARHAPKTARDLRTWDIIQLSPRPAALSLVPPGKRAATIVEFEPRISVDSAAAMRGLVLAGAGIAALPEVLVRRDLAQGHLVELLAGWHIPAMGVYAMWPSNTQRATLTLRLVDFLAERLAALFAP